MNIAFCINRLALIGLGVTVSSLVRNCSDSSRLSIWFLCADLNDADKNNVKDLLRDENFKGTYKFVDFDPIFYFGKLRSLHGDWTTYGRFLLPDILKNEDNVLYLDADLVVQIDVLQASKIDLGDYPIAAASGSQIQYSIEKDFFINECGLLPDDSYFNAGVLLINLSVWREKGLSIKCLEFGEIHSNNLLAADQTILNSLFNKNFTRLDRFYNCPWYADKSKPEIANEMILHYVGSPKPWDLGGSILHKGYDVWKTYLNNNWKRAYGNIGLNDIVRAWRIRKSYVRILKKQIFR